MTVKTAFDSYGRRVRFGRRRPAIRHPHLQLRNYMPKLPAPPPSVDYSQKAAAALSQMYENSELGDCVIAEMGHSIGVFTGNCDNPSGGVVFPNTEITQLYSTCCGYVLGKPDTDQGCDIQTVLKYWQNTGVKDPTNTSLHKIVGILGVDPTNVDEIQTAISLFENLIFGIELPDAWVNPIPQASGFVWDVAGQPDPSNGHCFGGIGYVSDRVMISTWGMTGWITNAAISEYAAAHAQGELYVVLSQDIVSQAQQVAPNGLNWAQLQADFAALGGVTPTPVPPSPPTPPIPPPVPPTPVPPPQPIPPPIPPAPPQPTPPTHLTPGTAQWMRKYLPPSQYEEYLAALENASRHRPRDL